MGSTYGRVNVILAEMSRTRIDDNWANKPIGSLSAILPRMDAANCRACRRQN